MENLLMSAFQRFAHPRLLLSLVVATLALAYSGCKKCDDGSDPGDDCVCDDGAKAKDCNSGADPQGGAGTGEGPTAEDKAVKELKASGVDETVAYAGDAVAVDFYGCARIGDSNNVVCAFDLTGAGYDWTLAFANPYCPHLEPSAIDDMGKEYHSTASTVAGENSCAKTLVEGVKTEARVRFDGVHSGASRISLLNAPIIVHSTQENPDLETLMFRDIPLE